MKFQYLSDIHLDIIPSFNLQPEAEYLILAGDVGSPGKENYVSFLQDCSSKFKKVFLVSGNHEYYSSKHSKDEIDDHIKIITSQFDNVHYLYKSSFLVDENTIVIGTTLWTLIDRAYANVIIDQMSDYSRIRTKIYNKDGTYRRYNIAPSNIISWHIDEYNWLRDEIKKHQGKKIIVITHHCPTLSGIHPKYEKYKYLNSAYASNLDHLFKEYTISYWIYGHTHTAMDFDINGCRLLCNPFGYEDEDDTGYQTGKCIEL